MTQSSHYRVQKKWPRFGGERGVELQPALEGHYQVSADFLGDLCGRTDASMSAPCSIASAYSQFQAPALKNNGVSGQHINHHIRKREPLDDPPRGGKVRYHFLAFWLRSVVRGDPFSTLPSISLVLAKPWPFGLGF